MQRPTGASPAVLGLPPSRLPWACLTVSRSPSELVPSRAARAAVGRPKETVEVQDELAERSLDDPSLEERQFRRRLLTQNGLR